MYFTMRMRIFSWVPEAPPPSHRAEKVHRMRFSGVFVCLFLPAIIFWRSGWLVGLAGLAELAGLLGLLAGSLARFLKHFKK